MSHSPGDCGAFPAPIYAETVLGPNFEDAKKHFLDALLEIHYAHTRMLAAQGILTASEERLLLEALDGLDREEIARARYDGSCEDLFFFIEGLLRRACGDLAGKMHTARSRNDIDITLFRMAQRRQLLGLASAIAELRAVLLDLAARNLETVMPAHTHTQPAQPTTLAHYLCAAIEFLGRDSARIQAAFARVNLCPLGACAITTTGFPIDRRMTARLLGFEGLAENSYGAIASVDYFTESAAAVAVAMVNLGKFVQDLLLWSTREFGFLRLSDAFVQCSSIMPQKRNPVSLEHARILASRALGEAQAVFAVRAQHAFRRHQRQRRRPPAAGLYHVRRRLALPAPAGGPSRDRGGRSRAPGAPRRLGFSHRHGAGRFAGPRDGDELSRGPCAGRPRGGGLGRGRPARRHRRKCS